MPHKLGNLWPGIANYDALLFAWKEVKQRKSSKVNILRYQSNLASNLSRLEGQLRDGTYHPRPHFEFWINDPKPRLIQAPKLEDRIVQHAVCNVLREPLTQRMIAHTYSCLIGRGTHRCSEALQQHLRNPRWRYYLSMDVRKFFYSINHQALYKELQRHIKCQRTLALLWQFITVNGGDGVGIPIGASTSQIMANMALNPLDHYARRELGLSTYLRYCDDMIALFETAQEAHIAFRALGSQLEQLGMVFNSKSGVGWIADGVDWVGYRHWPSYKILRKRTLKRLKRKAQGDCSLETTMAYLSHAKASASLEHVSNIFWRDAPEHRVAVHDWLLRHSPRYRMCSASHR
jgi:RNA-directed DNA polymerase